MQNNGNNTDISNSKAPDSISEIAPYDDWNSGSDAERSFSVQEQVQAYAPQEPSFYEYGDTISSHGEKLAARRAPQKGWWAAIAAAALLFFLLGGGVATWVMPAKTVTSASPVPSSARYAFFPFWNPKFNWIAENYIASSLHLAPQQITEKLQAGESMPQIAAAQGVSASDLQTIEQKAYIQLFDNAVQSGDISQRDADQWLQLFQHNPQTLEKATIMLFLTDPNAPPPTPKAG